MTLLKTTLMSAAFVLGAASMASTAYAQDGMTDKAKSTAMKEGKKIVKDKAADAVGEENRMMSDKGIDMGADMMEGKSAKDAAIGAATSEAKGVAMDEAGVGSISTGDAMTAGKVLVKGGSAQDAAMAVAKDRAKDQAKEMLIRNAGEVVGGQTAGTTSAPPIGTPTVPMQTMPVPEGATLKSGAPYAGPINAAPANCPSGTTAQPNGTCMITGDYNPG